MENIDKELEDDIRLVVTKRNTDGSITKHTWDSHDEYGKRNNELTMDEFLSTTNNDTLPLS